MPSTEWKMGSEKLNTVLVEFSKRLVTKFRPRLGECRFGDGPNRNGSVLQELKKRIQFGLDGRFEKVG